MANSDEAAGQTPPSDGGAAGDPLVSIVVLNYNKKEALRRNLLALRQVDYPNREIIVVDNHSSDGSAEMVRAEFSDITLIASQTNLGVNPGRNLVFPRAAGKYIICLDDDAVAPPDICRKTIELFSEHPQAGCLAFLIRNMPKGEYVNVAHSEKIGNYHGAGQAFSHGVLKCANYLDEDFFWGGEEIDGSLRLLEAGYYTRYTPEVVVEHWPLTYVGGEKVERTANWIAGWSWFYCKHFPLWYVLVFLTRILATYLPRCLMPGRFLVLPLAASIFVKKLPSIIRHRKVALPSTIAFYVNPATEPEHYNIAVWRKLIRHFSREFRSQ